MPFDHLLHWVSDLDAAAGEYEDIGLPIQPGGRHPELGAENRICTLRTETLTAEVERLHRNGITAVQMLEKMRGLRFARGA